MECKERMKYFTSLYNSTSRVYNGQFKDEAYQSRCGRRDIAARCWDEESRFVIG